MKLLIGKEDLAALEQRCQLLDAEDGWDGLRLSMELAWHLRERDSARALKLADETERRMRATADAHPRSAGLAQARLTLLRAEVSLLFAELARAGELADSAQAQFAALDHAVGVGDARLLQARILEDRGQNALLDDCLRQAEADYERGADLERQLAARAQRLAGQAIRDPIGAAQALTEVSSSPAPLAAAQSLAVARALVAGQSQDLAEAIRLFLEAYDIGLNTGQIRNAVAAAANAGEAFIRLGDLDTALVWQERALALARHTGWPGTVAMCLAQLGLVMLSMQRRTEARVVLEEAVQLMAPLAGSRHQANVLVRLGQLELEEGNAEACLAILDRVEALLDQLKMSDLLEFVYSCQAQALLMLGQAQVANEKAHAALRLKQAQGDVAGEIRVLQVLAQLHANPAMPAPAGMQAASASLHFLEMAMQVAAGKAAGGVPPELLQQLSRAQADSGDWKSAWHSGREALAAHRKLQGAALQKRALAMQVRHELEQAQAEAQRHQQLVQALQGTKATLETLSLVGREITACLDARAVFLSLLRHTAQMLELGCFYVFLLDEAGELLVPEFAWELGQEIEIPALRADSPSSIAARCLRSREEIAVDLDADPDSLFPANPLPGTAPMHSLLFSPLRIGERLLGVMTIQTQRPLAYDERERSIFRALCAYGAIALDNASAYAAAERAQQQAQQALQELRETQQALVQAEKLASLGGLVAGVAHELNTPLGNGLVAATLLSERLQQFRQEIATTGLKKQAFDAFLSVVDQSAGLTRVSLERSAKLVSDFKALAIDNRAWPRSQFGLDAVSAALQGDMTGTRKLGDRQLQMSLPASIQLDSYPSALSHLLGLLIDNALTHAFEGRDRGCIELRAEILESGMLGIRVRDDGVGIETALLPRLFDPFFTTRMGRNSGLGLYTASSLASHLLGGRLSVQSRPGEGSEFLLAIPLRAPG